MDKNSRMRSTKWWLLKSHHLHPRCQEAHWTGIGKSARCNPMEQVRWAEFIACIPPHVSTQASSCKWGCANCTGPGTVRSWTPWCRAPARMTGNIFTQCHRVSPWSCFY
jgi:hypothetical protein